MRNSSLCGVHVQGARVTPACLESADFLSDLDRALAHEAVCDKKSNKGITNIKGSIGKKCKSGRLHLFADGQPA